MHSFHKTRIAPTPSGYLHPGNAASFLLTQLLAQKFGAKILLRIDDGDAQRYRSLYAQHIFDSLAQLNIEYNEGPRNVADLEKVWSQRYRLPLYEAALEKLINNNQVFACICSRTVVVCDCEEKHLPFETTGSALRLRTTEASLQVRTLNEKLITASLPPAMKNFIVRKRDGLPAYQLCSVVDDLYFGVDLVVRGEDLWDSTLAQLQLAHALGDDRFAKICFVHHPLLLDERGEKLSKSAGNFIEGPNARFDLPALQRIAQDWMQNFVHL